MSVITAICQCMLMDLYSAPDLSRSGPQRDVAQYWYESGEDKTPLSASQNGTSRAQNHNYNVMSQSPHLRRSLMTRPQGNPVVIDVDKEAPYIGNCICITACDLGKRFLYRSFILIMSKL